MSPERVSASMSPHMISGEGDRPRQFSARTLQIGSLEKACGAITFILEHRAEVDQYLADQDRIFEEIKTRYPMPAEMIERIERVKAEKPAKPA
jgi:hypothetical protein